MQFDMSQAWSDALAKAGANFGLFAIIGGLFFFVPSVLLFVSMPDAMGAMMQPGFDPEDSSALLASIGPTIAGIYFLMLLASWIGYVAMIALASDAQKPTVGEAILTGVKALPTLIAITLIFLVAYFIIAIVLGLIIGVLVGLVGQASAGLGVLMGFIAIIPILLLLVWLFARLSMMMPLIALERMLNPFAIIARSWRLTGPVQMGLFLFFLILIVLYVVISLVMFMVVGTLIALVGMPSLLGFVSGITGALVAIIMSCLLVAVYNQLAGTSAERLSDTFE